MNFLYRLRSDIHYQYCGYVIYVRYTMYRSTGIEHRNAAIISCVSPEAVLYETYATPHDLVRH